MRIDGDRVYLLRADISGNKAPFEAYRDLAHEALRKVDLALPEAGPVLLKPNATVLFPAEETNCNPPGLSGGYGRRARGERRRREQTGGRGRTIRRTAGPREYVEGVRGTQRWRPAEG